MNSADVTQQNSPRHEFHDNNEYEHQQQQQQQQQDLTIDGIPNNFHHRRSRASRTFKNPPQPHMCIKEKTVDGREVFINVLSWTRIANPNNPDAPIPLYGGMKIPPGSPRSPPLVYAVMASPEVLKKAGRKCPDTPERMNLVDLMCEFVEAMNPTLHLSRKPEVLKDRDLSGELKDVWSAVQACRDKGRVDSGPPENLVVYTEFGSESVPSYEQSMNNLTKSSPSSTEHDIRQTSTSPPLQPCTPPSSTLEYQQQQEQEQQSAITIKNIENNSENNVKLKLVQEQKLVEELQQATENLKIQTNPTLPSSDPQQLVTQPPPSPQMPLKEPKNTSSHNFFPLFRSSKNVNSSNQQNCQPNNEKEKNDENQDSQQQQQQKQNIMKGLNFFRRNKSSSNIPPAPTAPQQTTPTNTINKQQADSNKINNILDDSLPHTLQLHHLDSNTNNEIMENSTTIVAK